MLENFRANVLKTLWSHLNLREKKRLTAGYNSMEYVSKGSYLQLSLSYVLYIVTTGSIRRRTQKK